MSIDYKTLKPSYRGLRCPWDGGVVPAVQHICVREVCDEQCVWRYNVEGRGGRPARTTLEAQINPAIASDAVVLSGPYDSVANVTRNVTLVKEDLPAGGVKVRPYGAVRQINGERIVERKDDGEPIKTWANSYSEDLYARKKPIKTGGKAVLPLVKCADCRRYKRTRAPGACCYHTGKGKELNPNQPRKCRGFLPKPVDNKLANDLSKAIINGVDKAVAAGVDLVPECSIEVPDEPANTGVKCESPIVEGAPVASPLSPVTGEARPVEEHTYMDKSKRLNIDIRRCIVCGAVNGEEPKDFLFKVGGNQFQDGKERIKQRYEYRLCPYHFNNDDQRQFGTTEIVHRKLRDAFVKYGIIKASSAESVVQPVDVWTLARGLKPSKRWGDTKYCYRCGEQEGFLCTISVDHHRHAYCGVCAYILSGLVYNSFAIPFEAVIGSEPRKKYVEPAIAEIPHRPFPPGLQHDIAVLKLESRPHAPYPCGSVLTHKQKSLFDFVEAVP